MPDQTSNFTTIYKIISEADFTGLVKGSDAIKNFARDTTASTKTVEDLTKITSAGVGGVSDFFETYQKGFNTITNRFTALSKGGGGAIATMKTLGKVVGDTLNTSLQAGTAGAETLGKLLSVDMVKGAVAFGVAAAGIVVVLGGITKGFYDATVAGITYARGMETTRTMLDETSKTARQLSTDLVDSANRASWSKVGKEYAGYAEFFVGLGRASIAVKGIFSNLAAQALGFATPFSAGFAKAGGALSLFAEDMAKSSSQLDRLRLSLADIGTDTGNVEALNEQFEKIGAAMGRDADAVRKFYSEVKVQTRDATAALNILQIASQGALGSKVFKENSAEVISTLTALKTGADAPISSLIRLGVVTTDLAGVQVDNAKLLERFTQRLAEMGDVAPAVVKKLFDSLNTGAIEAQGYDQRINRLRQFEIASTKIQLDAAEATRKALERDGVNEPQKLEAALAQEAALRKQYVTTINDLELRERIAQNNRITAVRGDEIQNIENNAKIERQILFNRLALAKGNADKEKAAKADLRDFEARIYEERRSAALRLFEAQSSLAKGAVDALRSAGTTAPGTTNEQATLDVLNQQLETTKARYAEVKKGTALDYEGQAKVFQLVEQKYNVIRDARATLLRQLEGGQQAINQLSAQAGETVLGELRRAKELANIRLEAIKEEASAAGLSEEEKLALIVERTDIETRLRDGTVAAYREIARIIDGISKRGLADLNAQRIAGEKLLAAAGDKRQDLLNPSQTLRTANRDADPNDVRAVANSIEKGVQGMRALKELEEPMKELYAAIKADPEARIGLLTGFLRKYADNRGASENSLVSQAVAPGYRSAVESALGFKVQPEAQNKEAMLKEIAALMDSIQKRNAANTETMLALQKQLTDAAAELVKMGPAAEQYRKAVEEAFNLQKVGLLAINDNVKIIVDTIMAGVVDPAGVIAKLYTDAMATGGTNFLTDAKAAGQFLKDTLDDYQMRTPTSGQTDRGLDTVKEDLGKILTGLDIIKERVVSGEMGAAELKKEAEKAAVTRFEAAQKSATEARERADRYTFDRLSSLINMLVRPENEVNKQFVKATSEYEARQLSLEELDNMTNTNLKKE